VTGVPEPFRFFVPPPTVFNRRNLTVDPLAFARPWFAIVALMVSAPPREIVDGVPSTVNAVTTRLGLAVNAMAPRESLQLFCWLHSGWTLRAWGQARRLYLPGSVAGWTVRLTGSEGLKIVLGLRIGPASEPLRSFITVLFDCKTRKYLTVVGPPAGTGPM